MIDRPNQVDRLLERLGAALPILAPSTAGSQFGVARVSGSRFNQHLVMLDRDRVGRDVSPSAAMLDSQSVRTTESGRSCGYDAGKKTKGRKRHVIVDPDGRALELQVGLAPVQDCDGAVPLLKESRRRAPFVELPFADTAYAAERVRDATCIAIEIVRKSRVKSVSRCIRADRSLFDRDFPAKSFVSDRCVIVASWLFPRSIPC